MEQQIEFILTTEVKVNNCKKIKSFNVESKALMGFEHLSDVDGEYAESVATVVHLYEPMLRLQSGRNYNQELKKYNPEEYYRILKIIKEKHLTKFITDKNKRNSYDNK